MPNEERDSNVRNLQQEISEGKQREKTLREEKNKLQAVVDVLDYLLTVQDKNYNVIYQNEGMRNMFGGMGNKCYKVYERRDKICESCPVEMAWKDGKSHTSERKVIIPSTGEVGYFETTANPIKDAEGKITSCLEVVRNITDRKKAEEELKDHRDHLEILIKERTAALQNAKDELIARQSKALLELSTPVIQVWDEILVLPLVGPIDTGRAQQIIEQLLMSISSARAVVAIIDITGVSTVDTSVANNILKAINASRMLGCECILTGVSPHYAQTLTKLGVDLASIITKGTLETGLRFAFEKTKNKVIKE